MSTPQSYPAGQDARVALVHYYLGMAMGRAQNHPERNEHSLKWLLTTSGVNYNKYLMRDPELRVLYELADSPYHDMSDKALARELEAIIRTILEESGDAQLLAEHGIRVRVRGGGIHEELSAIFVAAD